MIVFFRLKRNASSFFYICIYINHAAYDFSRAKLFNKLTGTVHRLDRIIRVKSLFELRRSVGTHTDLLPGETDVRSVKACRFEEHRLYIIRNPGVLSAHDSRNTDRLSAVADHKHTVV